LAIASFVYTRNPAVLAALNFNVVDYVSPYRKVWMDHNVLDLGSAGPILVPGANYVLGGGKLGWLYLLDRNNMGKIDTAKKWTLAQVLGLNSDATVDQYPEDPTGDKVVQKFQVGFQQYIRNSPSYLGPPALALPWPYKMATKPMSSTWDAMGRFT
jgi:hypothetical protein